MIRLGGQSAVRLTKFNSPILKSNNFYRNIEILNQQLTFLRDELGNYYLLDGFGGLLYADSSQRIVERVLKNKLLTETLLKHSMTFVISEQEVWIAECPGYVKKFSGSTFRQTAIASSYGISSG